MTKKIKIGFIILFLILVIAIFGCIKKDKDEYIITGTDGLKIDFLENYPQDSYVVSGQREPISVIVDIRNKGTFPDDEGDLKGGSLYLSGFDKNIINIERSKSLDKLDLYPVSYVNPNGGFDSVEFDGEINVDKLKVDRHDLVILATICYPYRTKAGPSVCVDPYPFDTNQEKVCKIGSQTLTSQGAPIAITKIDQEASTNKIHFTINVKNVGKGDVVNLGALEKCNPSRNEILERDDFDKIKVKSITIGSVNLLRKCGPFVEGSNTIKLFNGEGFIICSLDVPDLGSIKSAYTTPLNIELSYGYRSTVSEQIEIVKFTEVR